MSTADIDLRTEQVESEVARTGFLSDKRSRTMLAALVVFALLSFTRWVTDSDSLTSSGTVGTTLRVIVPILLAGLATLWAERCGVLNIGIEGLMIFGTWFGAWAAWEYGAWYGLLFGVLGGVAGALIHAVATVRFNVNHVISGTAINVLALGGMRYMSELVYTPDTGGGISQSPQQTSSIPRINIPFISGGEIFGWKSPDISGWLEEKHWFFLGDVGGIIGGFTKNVSWASVIALTLVPITAYILWRTRFGLRLRSSGEDPFAAESLGVKVVRYRYAGLAVSGALAGFAGAFLSIVSTSYYRQGQTGGRGFIGIAVAIFGNWTPTGVLSGAALFGFAEALNLVGPSSLPNIFLFGAMLSFLVGISMCARRGLVPMRNAMLAAGLVGVLWLTLANLRDTIDGLELKSVSSLIMFAVLIGLFIWIAIGGKDHLPIANTMIGSVLLMILWLTVEKVPEPLTKATPYVLTLIVLSFASQRLRPPAMAGAPYRPGESH